MLDGRDDMDEDLDVGHQDDEPKHAQKRHCIEQPKWQL
jgi:hypothetical protein